MPPWVGGEHHEHAALSGPPLGLVEQAAEGAVEPQQVVHLLLAVGPVAVADHVGGREADAQDVGGLVTAEVVALQGRRREVEQDLVRERRPSQVVVELESRRDAADGVREHHVLAVELAVDRIRACEARVAGGVRQQGLPDTAGVRVDEALRVPCVEPAGRPIGVPRAGHETAVGRLVPVGRVGPTPGRQDRGAVLERDPDHARRGRGRLQHVADREGIEVRRRRGSSAAAADEAHRGVVHHVHALAQRPVVPGVAHDARAARRAAREQHRVPRAGLGAGVAVQGVGEHGAALGEPLESSRVQRPEAIQVVGAHLVDGDEEDKPRRGGRGLSLRRRSGGGGQGGEGEARTGGEEAGSHFVVLLLAGARFYPCSTPGPSR